MTQSEVARTKTGNQYYLTYDEEAMWFQLWDQDLQEIKDGKITYQATEEAVIIGARELVSVEGELEKQPGAGPPVNWQIANFLIAFDRQDGETSLTEVPQPVVGTNYRQVVISGGGPVEANYVYCVQIELTAEENRGICIIWDPQLQNTGGGGGNVLRSQEVPVD